MEPLASVGRYHIERLIAHGGMGSLYLARDPAIGRLVAIKLLKEGFDDAAARERFAREARSAGRLHHPNIVTVFDVGEHGDRPFIAMEFVTGETLAQLIRRRAVGRLWEKLAILEAICAALHYAHGASIVHRDIKPANVMLDESGTVKILDFGIARGGGIDITRAGDVVGTLNYMSPEQLAGDEVDHRTDIYSVGALAYELITDQMSFPGTIPTGVLVKILNSSPAPIASLVPGIDPDIPAIIERAMAKQPQARYQDLESLRQDLVVVRTRLLETASETADAPSPDAETRVHSAGVGSGALPRSSPRAVSMPPSGARESAARSASHVREASHRTSPVVFVAAACTVVAIALALTWIATRSPVVSTPIRDDTAVQQVQPQPPTPVELPRADTRPSESAHRVDLEPQLSAVRATARQQNAAGERQAALDTLLRGLALDANDPEVNRLVDELSQGARRTATDARSAATLRGARSSAAFRDAQAREGEADRLLRTGDRVRAAHAFWAAASRYNQVPEVTDRTASAAPPSAAQTPPGAAPVEPLPSTPSGPPISPPSPPFKPVPAPIDKTAPTSPPAPLNPEPAPAPRDPAPDLETHLSAIWETLRRYTLAYQSLNSAAVGKAMPVLTPDQLRSLERDFSNYRSYTVDIRNERLVVDGVTATVRCQVVRSFETKNGVAGSRTVDSVFHLRRTGSAWTIERLESR